MLHVRRFAPKKMKKANMNVSWEEAGPGVVVAVDVGVFVNLTFHRATDGDEEMLVAEDEDRVGVRFLLGFLLLCPLLLHVSKLNLGFGFGFRWDDDNGVAADSSEDPGSDPCCCAFLFPAFD